MRYRDELRATSHAVVALQARTASLRDFRRAWHRELSVATRTDLAATAVRLRALAADLDALAAGPVVRELIGEWDGAPVYALRSAT